jgi:2-keto-3-deoxy-L-rhamnonate aldolase RhmA
LRISGDPNLKDKYPIDINHAASIQFGRLVETHWKFKNKEHAERVATSGFDYIILDEEDKQCVRKNILEAIYMQASNKLI